MLCCANTTTGKELWKVDTRDKIFFHQNFFGAGSVPLIEGDLLILPVGGSDKGERPIDFRQVKPNGTGIVAFDKKTGEVKYATGNELSSYASPVVTTIDGKKIGLYFARGGLLGFDPLTGKTQFHYKWRAKIEESVNASNPVVIGEKVLLTECYGPAAAFLDLKRRQAEGDLDRRGEGLRRPIARVPLEHADSRRRLRVQQQRAAHRGGADVRCVELKTGDVAWNQKR